VLEYWSFGRNLIRGESICFGILNPYATEVEDQKNQSREHEMKKTRNKVKKIFVFSNFRDFVIKISY